jgi:hypothetical protein
VGTEDDVELAYLRDEDWTSGGQPETPAAAATYPIGTPMERVHVSTDPSRCYTLASGTRVHVTLGCRCKRRN